jgi:hypothetical protein
MNGTTVRYDISKTAGEVKACHSLYEQGGHRVHPSRLPSGSFHSALTGPGRDAGRIPHKREWQALTGPDRPAWKVGTRRRKISLDKTGLLMEVFAPRQKSEQSRVKSNN